MSADIEIVISSADHADPDQWEQQRERIRQSGARFETSSRNWRLDLDLSDPQRVAHTLGPLLVAARSFGTTVLVIDPATGMPAITPLSVTTSDDSGSTSE